MIWRGSTELEMRLENEERELRGVCWVRVRVRVVNGFLEVIYIQEFVNLMARSRRKDVAFTRTHTI